jgi:hypothetical protein
MQVETMADNIIRLPVKSHPIEKIEPLIGVDLDKLILYLRSEKFQKFVRNDILVFEHFCKNESEELLKKHENHSHILSGIIIETKFAEILEKTSVQKILNEINRNPGLGESILFQLEFWKKEASK